MVLGIHTQDSRGPMTKAIFAQFQENQKDKWNKDVEERENAQKNPVDLHKSAQEKK